MDITPLIGADRQVIHGYGTGAFRVNAGVYACPILVFPDETVVWNVTGQAGNFRIEDFGIVFSKNPVPEILLIGTGKASVTLSPLFRAGLREKGIAGDAMDTGAACRTYNVLMAEGRRVAAALFPF